MTPENAYGVELWPGIRVSQVIGVILLVKSRSCLAMLLSASRIVLNSGQDALLVLTPDNLVEIMTCQTVLFQSHAVVAHGDPLDQPGSPRVRHPAVSHPSIKSPLIGRWASRRRAKGSKHNSKDSVESVISGWFRLHSERFSHPESLTAA